MRNRYALEPGVRALLMDLGLRPAAVLRRAGLRPDLLSNGTVWLSDDEFFSLWKSLESEANHSHLPLFIKEKLSSETFSPVLFAALMCPDLNSAARRVARYKRLIGPVRMEVDVADESTTVTFEWPVGTQPPITMVLTELLFWVELVRIGTRLEVAPIRVAMTDLPEDIEPYEAVTGVPIVQSDTEQIAFAASDAGRPFATADDAMWATFEPQLRRRLADVDLHAPTSERVRAVLLEKLPAGQTTVADVAAELAVSPRTLHRQLKIEGRGFQEILNGTRVDLAWHYLQNPALSAVDIAYLLGYAEPSSFYRAFHAWTGETPDRARSKLIDPQVDPS